MSSKRALFLPLFFFFVLGGTTVTPTSPAVAAPPTPIDVLNYVMNKKSEAEGRTAPSEWRRGSGDSIQPYEFEFGNNIIAIAMKMLLNDLIGSHFPTFYGNFFGEFRIIGLCVKKFPTVHPYVRYKYPYEHTQVSGMHQDEYTPDLITEVFRDLNDMFWYDFAETFTPFEVGRLTGEIGSGDANIDPIKDLPKEMRLRTWGSQQNPFIRLQYLQWQPLSMIIPMLFVPTGNCHDVPPPPIFFRSDNPAFITMTNLRGFSDILFPAEMGVMRLLPFTCTSHNIAKQVTNPVPFSFLAGAFEQKDLCFKAHGGHYPVHSTVENTRSFGNASYNSYHRGNNFWRRMFPGHTQDFAYYQVGNRYIDYVQAHYPEYLPNDWKTQIEDYEDFRQGGYEGGVPKANLNDPKRAYFTTWKNLRCCPKGYKVWIGPKPQLPGLHDFPGGKL